MLLQRLSTVGVKHTMSKITSCKVKNPKPAQVPRKLIGTDAFQETPIVEVTRQITKHNYLVMDLDDLPRIVKEVFLSSALHYSFCPPTASTNSNPATRPLWRFTDHLCNSLRIPFWFFTMN